jgi:hypothetical protein
MGHGHGNPQQGIGAEPALVLGAVEFDHAPVDATLIGDLHADHRLFQLALDMGHGLAHPLAEIAALVAIAQFQGLAGTG